MNRIYAYANRLDPTCLLFSQSFPTKNKQNFEGFKKQTTLRSIFRKLPSIQRVKCNKLVTFYENQLQQYCPKTMIRVNDIVVSILNLLTHYLTL